MMRKKVLLYLLAAAVLFGFILVAGSFSEITEKVTFLYSKRGEVSDRLLLAVDQVLLPEAPVEYLPETEKIKFQPHPRITPPSLSNIPDEIPAWALDFSEKWARGGVSKYHRLAGVALATGDERLFSRIKELVYKDSLYNMTQQVAYGIQVRFFDWFYDRWSEEEKAQILQLLHKRAKAFKRHYEETRYSPYNAMAYKRLQASWLELALVIYPDLPEAEPYFNWAKNILFQVFIPAWHQVSGKDGGGWHEGMNYFCRDFHLVLLDSFDAWEAATGQDLYKRFPWVENFIYYPIYFTRPDLTSSRWAQVGSSAHIISPLIERLGQEYDNPYALSYAQSYAKEPVVIDGKSWKDLPLVRHFDGLGIVVMRSSWEEDATYITFKAGDHYWSHSNMDSGSFTLYKKGALAIDSGLWTGSYSPHDINYSMQAIAHNVITVKDPEEPEPELRPGLKVANDGGQRRVGSGFSWPPSPDHLNHWKKYIDDYEMGDIVAFQHGEDYVYIAGDITAAYTNGKTGDGSIHNRNRRVEKWIRQLIFLPPNELLIYDTVVSTEKEFEKNWLLHTINEPIEKGEFYVIKRKELGKSRYPLAVTGLYSRNPESKIYQYDASASVKILLPEKYMTDVVGGPGREFFVDGENYDNNGKIEVDHRSITFEPGSWRIELSPKEKAKKDNFLVYIHAGDEAIPEVEMSSSEKLISLKIGNENKDRILLDLFKDGFGGMLAFSDGRKVDLTKVIMPNPSY